MIRCPRVFPHFGTGVSCNMRDDTLTWWLNSGMHLPTHGIIRSAAWFGLCLHPMKWPLKSDILVNQYVNRKSHLTSFAWTISICHQPAMSALRSSHLQVLHCTVTIKVVNLITCGNQPWIKPPNSMLQMGEQVCNIHLTLDSTQFIGCQLVF